MRTSESSGIIRTSKRSNYTVVDKTPFEDERLSWAARGVLAYLLTKPDNWKVRVNDLLKRAPGCGRDQMRGILAEIEAYGYLTREKVWNTETKRIDWDSVVHEAPQPADEGKIANLESRYKRRKKATQTQPVQATEIQAMEQCPEIQGIEIQAIENTSIYLVPNVPNTESRESKRTISAPRIPPTPKQTNLDSFNQAILIYKELSGKKHITPVLTTLIVTRVSDVEKWRAVIEAWDGSGFNIGNVNGMLDWYDHPEKMATKLARNSTPRTNGYVHGLAERKPGDLPLVTADPSRQPTPEERRAAAERRKAILEQTRTAGK